MAPFPRKIGGKYVMLGRQDHENVWLRTTDGLYKGDGGTKVVEPLRPWEFIRVGNGGLLIEIAGGWLVVTTVSVDHFLAAME